MSKPISKDVLLAAIEEHGRRAGAPLAEDAPVSVGDGGVDDESLKALSNDEIHLLLQENGLTHSDVPKKDGIIALLNLCEGDGLKLAEQVEFSQQKNQKRKALAKQEKEKAKHARAEEKEKKARAKQEEKEKAKQARAEEKSFIGKI